MPRKKYKTITESDRHTIERAYMVERKEPKEIAAALGVALSTLYLEINRGYTGDESDGRPSYSADVAQATTRRRGRSFAR